jgi:hypothetical protein
VWTFSIKGYHWTITCEAWFIELKKQMVIMSILTFSDWGKLFHEWIPLESHWEFFCVRYKLYYAEHKQKCYNNYQQKEKNIEKNDTIDSINDTFIISKAMFTCLFEGETANKEELNYKMILKIYFCLDAFYSYLNYFYLLEKILEEDLYRRRSFY